MPSPLYERKNWLKRTVVPSEQIRLVEHVEVEGTAFFEGASRLGLEGMVAKRANSPYEPGLRSRNWLKVKAMQSQEFVIGGYTHGEGYRTTTFGALLLGVYEEDQLRYAGRVGSGFDLLGIDDLLSVMRPLEVAESPFVPNAELDKTRCSVGEARASSSSQVLAMDRRPPSAHTGVHGPTYRHKP